MLHPSLATTGCSVVGVACSDFAPAVVRHLDADRLDVVATAFPRDLAALALNRVTHAAKFTVTADALSG